MKKKSLLLITDRLDEEPFLTQEIRFLEKYFAITIITGSSKNTLDFICADDCEIHIVEDAWHFFDLLQGVLLTVFSKIFWREALHILKSKEQIFKRTVTAIGMHLKAEKFSEKLKLLHIVESQQLIYTYWHYYKLLGTGMLLDKLQRKDIPIVSRIHGYDLYNERVRGGRQAFKTIMDTYLRTLFFVSQKGYNYYKEAFGFQHCCEYNVARLGVADPHNITHENKEKDLSLISVANAIPLKRIHLIIEALALIEGYSIRWVHFGDGSSLQLLQQLAKQELDGKENIEYAFKGAVANREIYNYYLTYDIDVFITTSSTEGLPVSLMEAFANGVPAIGTAVGGIPEMLHNTENGYLIAENPSVEDIVIALESMIQAKQTNILGKMKEAAYKTWAGMFDAENNFNEFVRYLISLC